MLNGTRDTTFVGRTDPIDNVTHAASMSNRQGIHRLSATAVMNIRTPGWHGDGGGLFLEVDHSGHKRWALRLTVNGRRRDFGLGPLHKVSLKDARELASEYRAKAYRGIDPVAEKMAMRTAAIVVPTFETCAKRVHAQRKETWSNGKHIDQWINTLIDYAFPKIGKKAVDKIVTADVLAVLEPIWTAKPETARRVRQRLYTVLDWARAAGHRSGDKREHGLHCEERVKNNEERKKQKNRRLDPTDLLMGRKHGPNTLLMGASKQQDGRAPYVPIKARTVSRKIWLDKKEVIDRMKAMRRQLDAEIRGAQGELWKNQVAERDALDQQTESAIDTAMRAVGDHYRSYWREMYKAQRQEVKKLARHLRELKDYKSRVREYERKNGIKRAPPVRDDMAQAADPKRDPMAELLKRHEQHKHALSRQHRGDAKDHRDGIMARHREEFEELRRHQESERHAARGALREAAPPITFAAAKDAIIEDREIARRRRFKRLRKLTSIKRAFDRANEIETPTKKRLRKMAHRTNRTSKGDEATDRTKTSTDRNTTFSRADEIKRDMAEWRKKNKGRDRGREM